MKFIRTLALLVLPLYFISCGSQQKVPNYFNDLTDSTDLGSVVIPDLVIQKNDQLHIQVYSASTRPEVSDVLYNLPVMSGGVSGAAGSTGLSGYLVDNSGYIEYPRIGLVQAEGLTKGELANVIKRRINETDSVLTNPSVIIRFLNLKVTVVGEVNSQGIINMPGERLTLLEAVGLAGGLTAFGMKEQVKVIREINGKRQVGLVDLSDEKSFDSPFYHLQQNDVVVVDPMKIKQKKAEQDVVIRQVSFGLSVLTAFALLYNIFN
jgi:polysaccharide export outer membrane protein